MTIVLRAGDDRVAVDPDRGGRLASLVAGGRERLITSAPDNASPSLAPLQWGSFPMAPWAGRIRDGVLSWGGATHQLERNLEGHAIHGVVFDEAWAIDGLKGDEIVLSCDFDHERWPLGGRIRQTVRLVPGRLDVTLTVVADDRAIPVWLGWHSCFRRPSSGDVRVGVAAQEALVTDGETIPTGERTPVEGDLDLRGCPPLGDRRLDDTLVAPHGPLAIRWPDLALDITVDPPPACAVVFTPAHEFCVEAQTAFPDAARLAAHADDTGLVALDPGGSMSATATWNWTTTKRDLP